MNKPVLGLLVGGVLGIFDGLSALVSAPQVAPGIVGIVVGSTFKGIVAGVIIGWYAKRKNNLAGGLLFGLLVGAFFATLIALMPADAAGTHYYWQIILPGSLVGLIVGYVTQKYGRPAMA